MNGALFHAIFAIVENKTWVSFQLIRGALPISHLFFVDDLILYAKATPAQATFLMRSFLTLALTLLLHPIAIQHILNVPPLTTNLGNDRCIWDNDNKGGFSVKSAYAQLFSSVWNPRDSTWLSFRRLQRPERIKYFIWLS
ncbi:hypothetical protein V6N12_013544 [Hibiscus sabdariffa]|uniref:Reverse transcriptase zinc-binding domain-containing protein n=1 Tax=Hibiscus sabdariffa TaxID=183260 RepID=A0ABR2C9P8_9ROSI